MKYSQDKPTEPGFYWVIDCEGHEYVERVLVRPGHSYLCVYDEPNRMTGKREFLSISHLPWWWAGPIKRPEGGAEIIKDIKDEQPTWTIVDEK